MSSSNLCFSVMFLAIVLYVHGGKIHSKPVPQTCTFGSVQANVTILGGLAAGKYSYVESAKDVFACGLMCCREESHDYAFILDSDCFCLTCLRMSLCKTVRITPPDGRRPAAIKLKRETGYSSKTFEPMSSHRGHRESPAVGVRQRFSQIFTEENRPRLIIYARYAIIFLFGFALGLVPFIKQYVDNCEANREVINKLIEEHKAAHNISLVAGTASGFRGPKVVRRTALAIGNKEIRLYCSGSITVEGVEAFGVSGKLEAIKKFNTYCKSHLKSEKNMNQCDVSLARVYGTNFPQVDSVTKVTYICRERNT